MTKIKDLATVTSDTILRLVPIDCERYEFAVCLGRWLKDCSNEQALRSVPVFCNESFMEIFLNAQANVQRCALAYKETYAQFPYITSQVDQDRARRFHASFSALGADLDTKWWRCFHAQPLGELVRTFWLVILIRLNTDLQDCITTSVH